MVASAVSSFLGVSALGGVLPAIGVSAGQGDVLDAIIIGAGAAGIGAASVLHASGSPSSYVVLEASQHVGGRVKSFSLGGVVLENGANWVSGAGPPPHWTRRAVNPLYRVAMAVNLSMVRVPGSATNMSNWWISDEKGEWSDLDRTKRDRADRVKTCVAKVGAVSPRDVTAAAAAAKCGWRSVDGSDRAIEWQLFTGETGCVSSLRPRPSTPPASTPRQTRTSAPR